MQCAQSDDTFGYASLRSEEVTRWAETGAWIAVHSCTNADPDCIYRLSEHLGHALVSTTEIYTGHLRRNGAMWRYSRDRSS
jgi:integrase